MNNTESMTQLVFLDQNAWVALACGSWDKSAFPREHAALIKLVGKTQSGSVIVPLTFTNIYETLKTNDPIRRTNLARAQTLISGGIVYRGRRQILMETLTTYIAEKFSLPREEKDKYWFLSDLWFESVDSYVPATHGINFPSQAIDLSRQNPARALADFMLMDDEDLRLRTVRQHSMGSAEVVLLIEARRAIASGETLAMRKRAYGARLLIDEINLILTIGRQLGLGWRTISDVGSSLARSIVADVPILNVERDLATHLEDQSRDINENDLRDMSSFITVLPFADVIIAEKQFVNLSRQARLDQKFKTTLMTSIVDF